MCPGTVDERVEEVVAGKRRIADLVLPKSSSLADLDAAQLRAALGIDPDRPCSPTIGTTPSRRAAGRGGPMSGPRRRRGTAGNARGAAAATGSAARGRKGRSPARQASVERLELWGAAAAEVPVATPVRITSDPAAVVRSLGRPPLAGHEVVAEHYLRAVYERAVGLARALAAVGELIETDD